MTGIESPKVLADQHPHSIENRPMIKIDSPALAATIEKALVENSFLVTKACRQLSHVKASDHTTLLHKIVTLFDHFSPETQAHPRLQKIVADAKAKRLN